MALADDLITQLRQGGIDGLEIAARMALEHAKRNVPVGDPDLDPDPNVSLADSGHLERDGDGYIIVFDTPYAAKVHENQRMKHPRGGGAKFLERALTEIVPTLDRVVASKVDARMARGLASDPARPHR